jgi:hypothetical protein
MAIERKPYTLHIRLDNISPADAIALMKMFKYMEYLGNIGSSRKCSFFADGDGSFHPKASFVYPIELPEVPEITGVVETRGDIGRPISRGESRGDFNIDSDEIAWHIYHDPEPEGYVRPPSDIPSPTNGKLSSKIGGD